MKKFLLSLLVGLCAIAIGVGAATAQEKCRGLYEAPFIDTTTGEQVDKSEGKVCADGYVKVEIETGMSETTFAICYYDWLTQELVLLNQHTTDEDGELKYNGQLLSGPYGLFGFTVHEGEDCSVAATYVSGIVVP